MATIRPNAEPAATTVAAGDIFLIDGATGVRALAATSVVLRDTTGKMGYSTGIGEGGAVTQLTSRTTGVTLNTPTGAITLFAAAGITSSWTSFTVTNSAVAVQDVILISVQSSTNTYFAMATAVAAGSFQISFTSIAGTAIDSPVLNFAVIKGAAS